LAVLPVHVIFCPLCPTKFKKSAYSYNTTRFMGTSNSYYLVYMYKYNNVCLKELNINLHGFWGISYKLSF
jgi:uncharacterized protein (DUF2225 family)